MYTYGSIWAGENPVTDNLNTELKSTPKIEIVH